jgi:hypothetical protein
MRADVAKGKRSEDRVGDRVRERVGIRMAVSSKVRIDPHTAEDQRAIGYESMDVGAEAYSHILRPE